MIPPVQIILTTAGLDTGPFNLYSDSDYFTVAFETNITRSSLLAGFTSLSVPHNTTQIEIRSIDTTCGNSIFVNLVPDCVCVEVVVDDEDILRATGNTDPSRPNGTVLFNDDGKQHKCNGDTLNESYTVATSLSVCMSKGSLPGLDYHYYENDVKVSYPHTVGYYNATNNVCTYDLDCPQPDCNISLIVSTTNSTGIADGTATANVTGANGLVTYLWSDGQTTQTATGLVGGDYTVTVTDTSIVGCTLSETKTIYETFTFNGTNLSRIQFTNLNSTTPYSVDWMGYSTSNYSGTSSGPTYDFGTPRTGTITITSKDLSGINLISLTKMTGTTTYPVTFYTSELYKLDGLLNAYIYGSTDGTGVRYARILGPTNELPVNLTNLQTFQGNEITGSTSGLPRNLINLDLTGINKVNGNTSDLPRNLVAMYIDGLNTISGDTYGLPTGLTTCTIYGNNKISGTTNGLPRTLKALGLQGSAQDIIGLTSGLPTGLTYINMVKNHISGSTSGLPINLTGITIIGNNAISGNTDGLPRNAIGITIQGDNIIGGDVLNLPRNLVTSIITSSSNISIYGNISNSPTGVTTMWVTGDNTISGTTSGFPRNLTSIQITGNNTINGNVSGLPTGLTSFTLVGFNTISGNVTNFPANVTYTDLRGFNTVNTYTSPRVWPNNMNAILISPTSAFSSTDVDNILNDLSGSTWTGINRGITLRGTRTAASNGAVTYLTGSPRNVTISITP